MNIITNEMLVNAKAGSMLNGAILLKEYTQKLTKTGKPYINGVFQSGATISFNAWNSSTAFNKMKTEEYSGMICAITGYAEEYNGSINLRLEDITAVNIEGVSSADFLPVRYNGDAYFEALCNTLKANISEKAYALADKILFSNEELVARFKEEFAASSHHDNCKSGTLAHTYKLISLLGWTLQTFKLLGSEQDETGKLVASQDRKDLLYLGTLLHDIGKTKEMNLGVYQPNSHVSHRYFGVELLVQFKDVIIAEYNEKWYYDLVAIMLQHHGEFGEPCKSICSYIVHQIDYYESRMMGLTQELESNINISGSGAKVWYEKLPLTL